MRYRNFLANIMIYVFFNVRGQPGENSQFVPWPAYVLNVTIKEFYLFSSFFSDVILCLPSKHLLTKTQRTENLM